MNDAVEISAADDIRVVRKADGTVWAWGTGYGAPIGDGSSMKPRRSPVLVLGPAGVKYTMAFDANGGKVSPAGKSITLNKAFGTLPTPTRSGYSFAGWFSEAVGGVKFTSTSKLTVASDVTAYARWTAKKYVATFNANGGTTPKTGTKVTKTKSVTFDSAYGTLPVSTRKGYTFDGWFTAKSGGAHITDVSVVSLAKAVTLYAHWTAKQFTVTLDPRSGDLLETSKQVTYAKKYGSLPSPTRAGYTFKGWFTKASGGSKVTSAKKVTITTDQTLFARWAAKKYKTTFNANGGTTPKTGAKVTKSKSVTFGKNYGTLPKSTLRGHTFAGWWTAASGGSQVKSTDKVTTAASVTLFAHWTAKTYTVKFNAGSGVVPPSSITVTYGQLYGPLPEPDRVGFEFLGWFTKASGGTQVEATSTVKITATQTLYAHWRPEG